MIIVNPILLFQCHGGKLAFQPEMHLLPYAMQNMRNGKTKSIFTDIYFLIKLDYTNAYNIDLCEKISQIRSK